MQETKPYQNEKEPCPRSVRSAFGQREPVAPGSRFSPKQRGEVGVHGQDLRAGGQTGGTREG